MNPVRLPTQALFQAQYVDTIPASSDAADAVTQVNDVESAAEG
jgi:hypothetical protein